jgi:hypothetical protein
VRWLLVFVAGCASPALCRTPSSHACTPAQIDRYLAACVTPETALVIRCEQARAAAPACVACLRAPDGPFKEAPGELTTNPAACETHGCARCDDLRGVALLFCS